MLDPLRAKIAGAVLGRRLRAAVYDRGYRAGYDEGYREGSDEGFEAGYETAQDTVSEWHRPLGY